jgi:hypothetical protein
LKPLGFIIKFKVEKIKMLSAILIRRSKITWPKVRKPA